MIFSFFQCVQLKMELELHAKHNEFFSIIIIIIILYCFKVLFLVLMMINWESNSSGNVCIFLCSWFQSCSGLWYLIKVLKKQSVAFITNQEYFKLLLHFLMCPHPLPLSFAFLIINYLAVLQLPPWILSCSCLLK